ncbi:MAG: hypothetical protein ABIZ05_03025 [Pseudonocardiaceae bacterium]
MVFAKRSITQGEGHRPGGQGTRPGQQVRIGAPHESLTAVSAVVAVSELVQRLGVIETLDGAVSSIKRRARGHSVGALRAGLATAPLAGRASASSPFPSHSRSFTSVRRLPRGPFGAGHGRCRPDTDTAPES